MSKPRVKIKSHKKVPGAPRHAHFDNKRWVASTIWPKLIELLKIKVVVPDDKITT